MIIPDANLLVYAHDERAPQHAAARKWWENAVNGDETIGIPWVVVLAFIRLVTHPAVLHRPLSIAAATERVSAWFEIGNVVPLAPAPDHWNRFREMLLVAGAGGNLTTDAHLAAIALENNAELHSVDHDFHRFKGLRWRNPLRDV